MKSYYRDRWSREMMQAVVGVAAFAASTAVADLSYAQSAKAPDTSRIVVAGGAITEVLYALGLEQRIVAVDSTSQFPAEALRTKQNLGYLRTLSTEGVLAMAPTLIVASDKAGPPEVVKALRSSGIAYAEIDDTPTPPALVSRVRTIAGLVGQIAKGEVLAKQIETDFAVLATERNSLLSSTRVLFVLNVQNGRLTVGGRNTAADTMLDLTGATNVASALEGFKPISEEALHQMSPEAIVVMTRSSGPTVRDALAAMPAVRGTPAWRRDRIIEMDGLLLMGFGPRAPEAARQLMRAISAPGAASGTLR